MSNLAAARRFFEWYNWITRRKYTDSRPPGVSEVLHWFGAQLNDILPDSPRQYLIRFLPDDGTDPAVPSPSAHACGCCPARRITRPPVSAPGEPSPADRRLSPPFTGRGRRAVRTRNPPALAVGKR
jgi:hypothetical protein